MRARRHAMESLSHTIDGWGYFWWKTEISIFPWLGGGKKLCHCSLDIFCFSLCFAVEKEKLFCFDNKLFSFKWNAPRMTMKRDAVGNGGRWCGVNFLFLSTILCRWQQPEIDDKWIEMNCFVATWISRVAKQISVHLGEIVGVSV